MTPCPCCAKSASSLFIAHDRNRHISSVWFPQSPYPDFYATNVILLKAETLVVNPTPMVAVGISPKSFGYYYFNNQEKKASIF